MRSGSVFYTVKSETEAVPASADANAPTTATLRLLETIPVKRVSLEKTERRYVSLGGELIGITLRTEGVLVVGMESFSASGGSVSPGEEAGLRIGDAVLSVDGKRIADNRAFTEMNEGSGGKEIAVSYLRDGAAATTVLRPRLSDATGKYKCGLWIRDCTNGIGTLTYTDIANGTVASLGHGIYDVDTNEILSAAGGEFRSASLVGVTKGTNGAAGELKGVIERRRWESSPSIATAAFTGGCSTRRRAAT